MNPLKKLFRLIAFGDITSNDEEAAVDKWKVFIAGLSQPKDALEQSYYRYLCGTYGVSPIRLFLLNLVSCFALMLAQVRTLKANKQLPDLNTNKNERILLLVNRKEIDCTNIFPENLKEEYTKFITAQRGQAKLGDISWNFKQAVKLIQKRYPHDYFFRLKMLRELSYHSRYLTEFNPHATVIYADEGNFADPLLTKLYEDQGRKLLSFMHGEYLLQIKHAFMSYSTYYIWDAHYRELFSCDLKCTCGNYIEYTPIKMRKKWALETIIPTFDFTYYFSGESKESVAKIIDLLAALQNCGYRCKARPHPRYSHSTKIRKRCKEYNIFYEDVSHISLEQSLGNTRYALGTSSTVLTEAYVEGRKVVIDDMSHQNHLEQLQKMDAPALKRPHELLSNFLQKDT